MVNCFEVAGDVFLRSLNYLFLYSIYDSFYFCALLRRAIEPVNSGHVRAEIESQCGIIAKKYRYFAGAFIIK